MAPPGIKKEHNLSFKHAFDGLVLAFSQQPNLKIHVFVGLLAVFLGWWLKISYLEWLILLFAISQVLVAEMLNTTIEAVTDLLTQKWHLQAKVAKDVGAGTVLLSAFCALAVGLVIFLPKIIILLG